MRGTPAAVVAAAPAREVVPPLTADVVEPPLPPPPPVQQQHRSPPRNRPPLSMCYHGVEVSVPMCEVGALSTSSPVSFVNLHAIEQDLRGHHVSMAWSVRSAISTQVKPDGSAPAPDGLQVTHADQIIRGGAHAVNGRRRLRPAHEAWRRKHAARAACLPAQPETREAAWSPCSRRRGRPSPRSGCARAVARRGPAQLAVDLNARAAVDARAPPVAGRPSRRALGSRAGARPSVASRPPASSRRARTAESARQDPCRPPTAG